MVINLFYSLLKGITFYLLLIILRSVIMFNILFLIIIIEEYYHLNLLNMVIGITLIYLPINHFFLRFIPSKILFGIFVIFIFVLFIVFRFLFVTYLSPIVVGIHAGSITLFVILYGVLLGIRLEKLKNRSYTNINGRFSQILTKLIIKVTPMYNEIKESLIMLHNNLFKNKNYCAVMRLCYHVLEFWDYCLRNYHISKYRRLRNLMRWLYYLPRWFPTYIGVLELLIFHQIYYFKIALLCSLVISLLLKLCIFWAYEFSHRVSILDMLISLENKQNNKNESM